MKAAIYNIQGRTYTDQLQAMEKGLARQGIKTSLFNDLPDSDADICVVWGWHVGQRVQGSFPGPTLVLERGYIGDRHKWTSAGWNGLNGRALFTKNDDAARFDKHFGHMLKEWKENGEYSLIMGQVRGDAALANVNILSWYKQTAAQLWRAGMNPMFRQHPVEVKRGVEVPSMPFAEIVDGSLDEALSVAKLVVTYNSNSAVDALLAGVPVHVEDAGSMVYDLASHDMSIFRPAREKRLAEIAWSQFSMEELKSGACWDIVKLSMEEKP